MAEYPAIIQGADITANLDGEHYNIVSPITAKEVIKALPGARWDARARVWQVKKRWHAKIGSTLAGYAAGRIEEMAAQAEAKAQAEARANAAARDADAAGRAAIGAMKPLGQSSGAQLIYISGGSLIISTAYHPEIVALARRLGGKFGAGRWLLPVSAGVSVAAARDAIRDWHNETVEANRRKTAERSEQSAFRVLSHRDLSAPVGKVVRIRGVWRVVESHGKWFRADESLASMGHPDLYGEQVRWAYTRAATEAEIAAAEAEEAAQKAAGERIAAQRAAVAAVAAGEVAPATGAEPEGEVVWRDDTSAATGYRRWIVMGADGWLYHLTYDGSDGAMWGDYNAGYNTRAVRIPADPALLATIRRQGS